MGNKFFIGVLVAIAAVFGVVLFNKQETSAPESQASVSDHVQGAGTTGVELVEYGDFECPSCAAYYPIVKQVKEEFGDEITFRFRHFPLTQIHQNAMAAHRAAEAAGNQGKFFEMHDMLFERRDQWIARSGISTAQAISIFEGYAEELGLDVAQYKVDASAALTNDIINNDVRLGQEAGASGTPTFVLDGKVVPLEEIRQPEAFIAKVREAIEAKSDNGVE